MAVHYYPYVAFCWIIFWRWASAESTAASPTRSSSSTRWSLTTSRAVLSACPSRGSRPGRRPRRRLWRSRPSFIAKRSPMLRGRAKRPIDCFGLIDWWLGDWLIDGLIWQDVIEIHDIEHYFSELDAFLDFLDISWYLIYVSWSFSIDSVRYILIFLYHLDFAWFLVIFQHCSMFFF